MLSFLNKYLRGAEGAAPAFVRLFRGVVEVAFFAGTAYLIDNAVDFSPEEWKMAVAFMIPAVTVVEGVADQILDPTQNRAPKRD